MTLLAVAGVTAAAFFILRKLADAEQGPTLESALDQCESAASLLDRRVSAADGVLVS